MPQQMLGNMEGGSKIQYLNNQFEDVINKK